MKNVADLFLKLVSYDTQADGTSKSYPSTTSQIEFAKTVLIDECNKIGLSDVTVDEYGYLFATDRKSTRLNSSH